MSDTTPEMQQMQREIFRRKTISERFLLVDELISFGRKVIEGNIRQNNPDISDLDLKIAVVKRCYGNEFSETEMDKIIESISNFHHRQRNPSTQKS
jgi:hypothetical protein